MSDERRSRGSRELVVHAGAAGLGAFVGPALLGTFHAALVLRSAALTLALTLVAAALVLLVRLGRSEWRREAPRPREYVLAGLRFVVAFLLVVGATA